MESIIASTRASPGWHQDGSRGPRGSKAATESLWSLSFLGTQAHLRSPSSHSLGIQRCQVRTLVLWVPWHTSEKQINKTQPQTQTQDPGDSLIKERMHKMPRERKQEELGIRSGERSQEASQRRERARLGQAEKRTEGYEGSPRPCAGRGQWLFCRPLLCFTQTPGRLFQFSSVAQSCLTL